MKYSLIIFDFDGTLCDNRSAAINSIRASYKYLGKGNPSEDEIQQALSQGESSFQFFKRLNPDLDDESIRELKEGYQEISAHFANQETILFEGVIALLTQLKKDNIPCIIVSNRADHDLYQAVQSVGLMEYKYIAYAIGIKSDYAEKPIAKPDPLLYTQSIKPFLSNIDLANIHPSEILVVGDSIADLSFAEAIGADVCWVSYGHGDAEACKKLLPTYIVDTVEALATLLTKEYKPSQHHSP